MAQKNLISGVVDQGAYSGPGDYTKKFTVALADINAVATTGDTILLMNMPAKAFVTRTFLKHSILPAAPSLTTCTCTINTATNVLGASLNLATAVGPTVSIETSNIAMKEADPALTTPVYLTFNFAGATAGTFTAGSIDVDLEYVIEP